MTTTTNFHSVKSIKVEQRRLKTSGSWVTEIKAQSDSGETYSLTLFHSEPLPMQGAEFVSFVASDEEAS
jgi:hypothetical protein